MLGKCRITRNAQQRRIPNRPHLGYREARAVVVVEGATVRPFVTEVSTMLILGIVLSVVGVGFFCWLLFTLAVYALPFFAGLTAALAAFHSGSGVIGALVIGVLAGGATLAIGQIAFATVRTPLIRAAIALLFAVPAAIAGYHATSGSRISACRPKAGARHSRLSALFSSARTAWARMSLFVPPTVGRRVQARLIVAIGGSDQGRVSCAVLVARLNIGADEARPRDRERRRIGALGLFGASEPAETRSIGRRRCRLQVARS